jgi:hypothetical protein
MLTRIATTAKHLDDVATKAIGEYAPDKPTVEWCKANGAGIALSTSNFQ